MPPAAKMQAMIAPKGPVAVAKVLGREDPGAEYRPDNHCGQRPEREFSTDAIADFCSGAGENFARMVESSFAAVIPCWPPARLVARIGYRPLHAAGVFLFFLLYFFRFFRNGIDSGHPYNFRDRPNFFWNLPISILSVRTL